MSGESYIETKALLAVMNGDKAQAIELLDSMLPNERKTFAQHVGTLDTLVCNACYGCNQTILDTADLVTSGPLFGPSRQWHRACHAASVVVR